MPPSKFGAAGTSYVHPLIIAAILVAVVLMFVLPRKRVIIPFLAAALLIPMDQVLVIGGLQPFRCCASSLCSGGFACFFLRVRGESDSCREAGTVLTWQSFSGRP